MQPKESPLLQLDLRDGSGATPPQPSEPSIFRPIHYLGSKLRLAPAIASALDDADASQGTVLDLFAGSGTTALTLAGRRSVIASDIQEYSRVICSALLLSRPPSSDIVSAFAERLQAGSQRLDMLRQAVEPLVHFERQAMIAAKKGEADAICAVLEHGSILAAERGIYGGDSQELCVLLKEVTKRLEQAGLIGSPLATTVRYFGGSYFSYAQAVELDCLAMLAQETAPAPLTDLFTATLLSTASDIVNTVGKQFAQPIRPKNKQGIIKKHLLSKINRDRNFDVQVTYLGWLKRYALNAAQGTGHKVARSDYREALKKFAGQYSVVYADPPYTRDHYSRFYHVLETLALRDNPSIARSPGSSNNELSRGLYRDDRHQSPFCIRSQAPDAFRELFKISSQNGAQMVVSYSPFQSGAHPRLMKIDNLLAMAREFYKSVELETVDGVSHSKLNHSSLNLDMPSEAEILIICRLTR